MEHFSLKDFLKQHPVLAKHMEDHPLMGDLSDDYPRAETLPAALRPVQATDHLRRNDIRLTSLVFDLVHSLVR
jgi:hypothetical protein